MCLFDGFRLPSIRRLTRKPQTICFSPLINYNPALFAPETILSIGEHYKKILFCDCIDKIDPTTHEVTSLIATASQRGLNERIVIHYFGQGSKPPVNGQLYFFNSCHNTYRGLSLDTVIGKSRSPVALIIDSNNAGSLIPSLNRLINDIDIVAFMACREGEVLPSAPSLPLDILSSSILFPSESAIWFHSIKSLLPSSSQRGITKNTEPFVTKFLNSIIDSIAMSSFSPIIYESLMTGDQTLRHITIGFILATRILNFFNVHTCSFPETPNTANSELWGYWDLILDTLFVQQGEFRISNLSSIFDQLLHSMLNFPMIHHLPLLFYLITTTSYVSLSSKIIYIIVERKLKQIPSFIQTEIVNRLISIRKPSKIHFLTLAKLFLDSTTEVTDLDKIITEIPKLKTSVLTSAMLTLCCSITTRTLPNQTSLLGLCQEYCKKCAPYSLILFGLIVQKSDAFITDKKYAESFIPLLNSNRIDIRISAVFALGYTRDITAIPYLIRELNDSVEIVRCEALCSLAMALRFDMKRIHLDQNVINDLKKQMKVCEDDKSPKFNKLFSQYKQSFLNFIARAENNENGVANQQQVQQQRYLHPSNLVNMMRASVRANNILERYRKNIFDMFINDNK
ncbi:WD repeat containing protein mip1 [Histomonas meleagridis]|uniref:WD repeat containing protein mip1 n=1 Tax=Histomonas meleagridis TaxID=135588 RepID=UPI00355A714E|nr:WD repeat containing protein mip1 [Histomonas meleagridis]KAH0805077.1 WD repeat containing protein mip1 [Histomonas meleagridis]